MWLAFRGQGASQRPSSSGCQPGTRVCVSLKGGRDFCVVKRTGRALLPGAAASAQITGVLTVGEVEANLELML